MPVVEAFEPQGYRCWFYSDDHRPAHFHAGAVGEWEIRVFFLLEPPQLEVVFRIRHIPGRVRRELLQLVSEHRAALFEEWSEKVYVQNED